MTTRNSRLRMYPFGRRHPKSKMALALLLSLSLYGKVSAQVCAYTFIRLEGVDGAGAHGKIGYLCSSPGACPTYYLEHTTGIASLSQNWINGSYSLTDNGTKTVIDPSRKYDGTPMPDTCPEPGGFETTTYLSGSVVWTGWCPGSDPMTSTWHKNTTTGSWYNDDDPDCVFEDCNPAQPSPIPDGADVSGPTTTGPCNDLVTTTTWTYGDNSGSSTTEEKFESEYTTGTIKSRADAVAQANLPSSVLYPPWHNEDPSSSRSLAADETCASENQAKYRFQIGGTDPKRKYKISWVVTTVDASGSRSELKQAVVQGRAGTWYYPSLGGEKIPLPSWPPGCPTGGTYSIKYSSPSLTLAEE